MNDREYVAESISVAENLQTAPVRERIPSVGLLSEFRLGPIAVLDENGLLVPLCTSVDLLRGCRSFWRGSLGVR